MEMFSSAADAKPDEKPQKADAKHRGPILIDRSAARGHIMRDQEAFGQFSPRWSIPSSRREQKPFLQTPAPDRYELPKFACIVTKGAPISPRTVYSNRTVTSDADLPDVRVYPVKRRKTIGERKSTHFYEPTEGADHFFNLRSDLSKGVRIRRRHREPRNQLPGPGEYSPEWPQTPLLTTVGKARDRTLWKIREGPSPADYTIREPPTPKWRGAIRPIPRRIYTDE
jgi:hypothetical protein